MRQHTIEKLREYRRDLFDADGTDDWDEILLETPEEDRLLVAYMATLVKWEPDAPHRGHGACGLCDLMHCDPRYQPDSMHFLCAKCPLYLSKNGCNEGPRYVDTAEGWASLSLWRRWNRATLATPWDEKKERDAADALYAVLKRLYEEELGRRTA